MTNIITNAKSKYTVSLWLNKCHNVQKCKSAAMVAPVPSLALHDSDHQTVIPVHRV